MERLLHTPEGVRDIYNDECERKMLLQEHLHEVLKSYGYRDIETPTFEFFDVFSREVGSIPSRELYKFFDREGNTLVLRPDITPSIARAAAKYFGAENTTIRLCYEGNTFINNSSYQGRLKENTHLGAELIGSDTAQADAEIIAMVVDCLKRSGLEEFQISIGQIEYFKSILKEITIDLEKENELKDFISNRNIFGVENLLEDMHIDDKVKNTLLRLPELYGGVEILDAAEKMAVNDSAVNAVRRLKEIYNILKCYGITKYISFDLSMLSRYNYYTGIFFRGYTFGSGDAVVKGGRYDNLMKHFGKDAPSIGFVVVVDQLLSALARQKIPVSGQKERIELYYQAEQQEMAIRLAGKLRSEGQYVSLNYLGKDKDSSASREMMNLCKKYGITKE